MHPRRVTNLLRALFVILAGSLGALIGDAISAQAFIGSAAGFVFGLVIVLLDRLVEGVSLRAFSSATVGLLVGLLAAQLLKSSDILRYQSEHVEWALSLLVYAVFGYIGMMLAMRSNRDEFALIIPYVRFTRQSAQDAPLVLDTNIIIDGRLLALCGTQFISGALVVPTFIIDELQRLADSADPVKRMKGRRGLDTLRDMQTNGRLDINIHQSDISQDVTVDEGLVQVAQILSARLLTNDLNLCKAARLKGVPVLNIDELAFALRPQLKVGDTLELMLTKEGREDHQAVGFLPEGTMVVVNHARKDIGHAVSVQISSTLQTGAGRLFFADKI